MISNENSLLYDFIFIILNYNSVDYIESAISSIRNCSTSHYRICIADNNSTNPSETERLQLYSDNDVDVVVFNDNKGYGAGNNRAIRYMKERYQTKYFVIMNPDVELIEKNTIEDLIFEIEKDGAIGGQPLVWNYNYGDDPRIQINIGRFVDYKTLCIHSSLLLRTIMKKAFNHSVFVEEMPYLTNIRYIVPSGAFFVISYDCFEAIGGFDERTFLYGEETIIGFKVNESRNHFLFSPNHIVKHLQGASTGYNKYVWNRKRLSYLKTSRKIYLHNYLKTSAIKSQIVMMLLDIDYLIRKIYAGVWIVFHREK